MSTAYRYWEGRQTSLQCFHHGAHVTGVISLHITLFEDGSTHLNTPMLPTHTRTHTPTYLSTYTHTHNTEMHITTNILINILTQINTHKLKHKAKSYTNTHSYTKLPKVTYQYTHMHSAHTPIHMNLHTTKQTCTPTMPTAPTLHSIWTVVFFSLPPTHDRPTNDHISVYIILLTNYIDSLLK